MIEILPEYYLTANFYKPDARGAVPGILFLCGHSHNGKAYDMYAAFCAEAVLNGFCVLTFDPPGQGERFYRDNSGPDDYHCHVGHQMFALGQPLSTYMLYECIRALDYLTSRPEADVNKLAVAGQSGGGQTSAFLGAFDGRLAAIAPSCYITELSELARGIGIQEIEQTPLGFLSAGLGLSDLIIAAAPRPYMVSGGLFDYFPVEGLRGAVLEAKRVYNLLGGRLETYISGKTHGFWTENRRAALEFFCDVFFKTPPRFPETGVEIPAEADLYCAGGDVRGVSGVTPLAIARQKAAENKRPIRGEAALDAAAGLLQLEKITECQYDDLGDGEYKLYPEPGMAIHATLIGIPGDVTVFAGTPDSLPVGLDGAALCVEARGTGRAALPRGCFHTDGDDKYCNRESAVNWNAMLHGRSMLGMRALDIACGVALARALTGGKVTLAASGESALPALFSCLASQPDKLALNGLLKNYGEVTGRDEYDEKISALAFGLGVDYDIPDIITALRGRGIRIKIEYKVNDD